MDTPESRGYRRIATEEAWCTRELMARYHDLLKAGTHNDPGFQNLWGFFAQSQSPRARDLYERIQDVDQRRIADMDAAGIDLSLLMLTAPGVQMFSPDEACALARDSNDQLAAAIARHPTRLAGLAAFARMRRRQAQRKSSAACGSWGSKGPW